VTARFENVGSLKVRAPVSMSGVTIGRVSAIELDPAFLEAKVTLDIDQTYDQIPDDSDAAIQTSGMLGSQYIGIQAGGSETSLAEGSEIEFTQSAIVLENLISKYLFSSGGDDEDEDEQ
jgi:phospholipid/cholesterol/gamma-HCH transport system substrate-binding protein